MGAVYLGEQEPTGRPVAVKVLQPEPEIQRRFSPKRLQKFFFHEAHQLARFSHPSVVTLLDYDVDANGTAFIVMEHLQGETLKDRLKSLSPRDLAHVCVQLLDGLHAAHQAGLVHRDVKPGNIIVLDAHDVDGRPRAKLLDFGIASSIGVRTSVEDMMGTPRYMAPEMGLTDQPISPLADLYSIGVILYEGLCGRVPFNHPNMQMMIDMVCNQTPPPLPYRGDLPTEMYEVVGRALAKSPEDRFADAHEMAQALREMIWPDFGQAALKEVFQATLEISDDDALDETLANVPLKAPPFAEPEGRSGVGALMQRLSVQLTPLTPSAPRGAELLTEVRGRGVREGTAESTLYQLAPWLITLAGFAILAGCWRWISPVVEALGL